MDSQPFYPFASFLTLHPQNKTAGGGEGFQRFSRAQEDGRRPHSEGSRVPRLCSGGPGDRSCAEDLPALRLGCLFSRDGLGPRSAPGAWGGAGIRARGPALQGPWPGRAGSVFPRAPRGGLRSLGADRRRRARRSRKNKERPPRRRPGCLSQTPSHPPSWTGAPTPDLAARAGFSQNSQTPQGTVPVPGTGGGRLCPLRWQSSGCCAGGHQLGAACSGSGSPPIRGGRGA